MTLEGYAETKKHGIQLIDEHFENEEYENYLHGNWTSFNEMESTQFIQYYTTFWTNMHSQCCKVIKRFIKTLFLQIEKVIGSMNFICTNVENLILFY